MRIYRLFAALLLSALLVLNASAQEDTPVPPILQILSLVPDTARQGFVGYSDVRAAEQTRPGAAQPESFAEFLRLREQKDPSGALWVGAFPGSGFGMAQYLLKAGETMPEVMGFDLLDIDRAVTFGEPPAVGDILMGDFDQTAIDKALTAQGFVADELNGLPLWCSESGCQQGGQPNLQNVNPGNIFGGEFGRQQPMMLSGDFLYSSGDFEVVESITERAADEKRSLAEVPEYQVAVKAMTDDPDSLLRQAYFVHPLQINPYPLTSSIMFGMLETTDMDEMPEKIEDAVAAVKEQYGELPPYRLLALADYADEDHQYASIILVYEDVEDAQAAADLIPQRIEIAHSMYYSRPLREVFEERKIAFTPTVIEDEATGLAAAVFVTRYDHPQTEPGELGMYHQPGLSYRYFQQMIFSRDTMWLSYDLG